MADCLNNEEQINSNLSESNVDALTSNLDGASSVTSEMSGESSVSSTMYSVETTASNLGSEEPLNSELDLPTTYTYKGSETDNITVTVDNKGFIISASVKQIKFDSFSDFPEVGSEHLIYIDATNKTLYGWDASIPAYYKLVADVEVPTKTSDLINDGNGTEGSRYATTNSVNTNMLGVPSNSNWVNISITSDQTLGTALGNGWILVRATSKNSNSWGTIYSYVGNTNPENRKVQSSCYNSLNDNFWSVCIPVKKGDTYKIHMSITNFIDYSAYFVPAEEV